VQEQVKNRPLGPYRSRRSRVLLSPCSCLGSGLAAPEELNPGKRLLADSLGDRWVMADSRGRFVRGQRLGNQELHQAPSLPGPPKRTGQKSREEPRLPRLAFFLSGSDIRAAFLHHP